MKGLIVFYRVLAFILLPIAALLLFFGFVFLLGSFSSPENLIAVFICGSVGIYVFASFSFLNKGVLQNEKRKSSFKDLIKVNAFVSIFFAIYTISKFIFFLNDPVLRKQTIDQAIQISSTKSIPNGVTYHQLEQAMMGIVYFVLFISLILLIHIFITFRLLILYKNIFQQSE